MGVRIKKNIQRSRELRSVYSSHVQILFTGKMVYIYKWQDLLFLLKH